MASWQETLIKVREGAAHCVGGGASIAGWERRRDQSKRGERTAEAAERPKRKTASGRNCARGAGPLGPALRE